MNILSIFHYDFMIRAFVAGIVTAVIAPTIGIFLVTRRYSLIADTLSHVSLAGVAIGYLAQTQPIITAIAASVTAALAVEQLRSKKQVLGESALALFLSGSLALAAVLLSAATGLNVNLGSILFGSIATVDRTDIVIIAILGLLILFVIAFLYKELVAISFDEELAAAGGLPVAAVNRTLMIMAAVTIALSMRIVGILLIGALMVIPVIAAIQWQRSFRVTLVIAVCLSLLSTVIGLYLSYYANLSSGGTIVLLAVGFFLLSTLKRKLADRF